MSLANALNKLATSQIANIHNEYADLCVNRFRDKETAVSRTMKLLEAKGITLEQVEVLISNSNKSSSSAAIQPKEEKTEKKKTPKQDKVAKEKRLLANSAKVKSEGRRKHNYFESKSIHFTSGQQYKYNKGSIREVVIGKMKSGMSFDEFLKAGGNKAMLQLFINNGNVEVK